MKRSIILAMVLIFLLSVVAYAQEPIKLGDPAVIAIKAHNPVYGEIQNLQDTPVTLAEFSTAYHNQLKREVTQAQGTTNEFQIKSNAYLKVTLSDLVPLTHVDYEDVIATSVTLRYRKGNSITNRAQINTDGWENPINRGPVWIMCKNDLEASAHPSGRGNRTFYLSIWGRLGDIHEQAAGDYEGSVTITLAAID